MFSNKNVRWAIVVAFMITLLATPKPALALSATGSGYQDGSNCYGYQDGNNCYGNQDGNNCYDYQGGNNCYGYQDGGNSYGYQGGGAYSGCQYGANCYGNQYGGNNYASYGSPNAGTYVVQRGDTMRIIADRLGIPLGSLIAANPNIWNPNLIYAGQVICLPGFGGQPAYFQPPQTYAAPAYYQQPQSYGPPAYYQPPQNFGPAGYQHDGPHHQKSSVTYYTVQKGDTLAFVAHEFGTTVKALLEFNTDLKKNEKIRVGDILRVQ